jgi:hypothetical protein
MLAQHYLNPSGGGHLPRQALYSQPSRPVVLQHVDVGIDESS